MQKITSAPYIVQPKLAPWPKQPGDTSCLSKLAQRCILAWIACISIQTGPTLSKLAPLFHFPIYHTQTGPTLSNWPHFFISLFIIPKLAPLYAYLPHLACPYLSCQNWPQTCFQPVFYFFYYPKRYQKLLHLLLGYPQVPGGQEGPSESKSRGLELVFGQTHARMHN